MQRDDARSCFRLRCIFPRVASRSHAHAHVLMSRSDHNTRLFIVRRISLTMQLVQFFRPNRPREASALAIRESAKTILSHPEENFPDRAGCHVRPRNEYRLRFTLSNNFRSRSDHCCAIGRTLEFADRGRDTRFAICVQRRIQRGKGRFSSRPLFAPRRLPSLRHERASRRDDVKDSSQNRSFPSPPPLSLSLSLSLFRFPCNPLCIRSDVVLCAPPLSSFIIPLFNARAMRAR